MEDCLLAIVISLPSITRTQFRNLQITVKDFIPIRSIQKKYLYVVSKGDLVHGNNWHLIGQV